MDIVLRLDVQIGRILNLDRAIGNVVSLIDKVLVRHFPKLAFFLLWSRMDTMLIRDLLLALMVPVTVMQMDKVIKVIVRRRSEIVVGGDMLDPPMLVVFGWPLLDLPFRVLLVLAFVFIAIEDLTVVVVKVVDIVEGCVLIMLEVLVNMRGSGAVIVTLCVIVLRDIVKDNVMQPTKRVVKRIERPIVIRIEADVKVITYFDVDWIELESLRVN